LNERLRRLVLELRQIDRGRIGVGGIQGFGIRRFAFQEIRGKAKIAALREGAGTGESDYKEGSQERFHRPMSSQRPIVCQSILSGTSGKSKVAYLSTIF